ncbi:hypothetical protein R8510_01740 [Ralstonia chuxiongensis]|nr:hypothetical protein R8510_01740 [Ralstonia chuxiongensis]
MQSREWLRFPDVSTYAVDLSSVLVGIPGASARARTLAPEKHRSSGIGGIADQPEIRACRPSQMPATRQSRRRRQQLTPEPKPSSGGNARHGIPVLSTYRMPFNAARSGRRLRPGYRKRRCFAGGINGSRTFQRRSSIKAVTCMQQDASSRGSFSTVAPRMSDPEICWTAPSRDLRRGIARSAVSIYEPTLNAHSDRQERRPRLQMLLRLHPTFAARQPLRWRLAERGRGTPTGTTLATTHLERSAPRADKIVSW